MTPSRPPLRLVVIGPLGLVVYANKKPIASFVVVDVVTPEDVEAARLADYTEHHKEPSHAA